MGKGISVIYLLVFTHRAINQSHWPARSSGSVGSRASQNALSYVMRTWGGLASNYLMQLLSDSREEKTKGGEDSHSHLRDALLSGTGWKEQGRQGKPLLEEPPESAHLRADPSTWAGGCSTPAQPNSRGQGLFSPWEPMLSIQFSNGRKKNPSCSIMKRYSRCRAPETDLGCVG